MRLHPAKTAALVAIAIATTFTPAHADKKAIKAGKKVFKKCKACHDIKKPKNKVGPHLIDIMGRKAGTIEGFKYSKAMLESGLVWDAATLDEFLTKPKTLVKGTKMAFGGLKKEKQRADLITYLQSLSTEAEAKAE